MEEILVNYKPCIWNCPGWLIRGGAHYLLEKADISAGSYLQHAIAALDVPPAIDRWFSLTPLDREAWGVFAFAFLQKVD